MNNIIKWLKLYWSEYLYTKTTALALVLVYLEVFHFNAIDGFWSSLGANTIITTAIDNIIVGFLIRSKK